MRKELHEFYFVSKGTIFDNGKYIKRIQIWTNEAQIKPRKLIQI